MKNRKGFTLIELLAVIVILGIIMLVAIPAVTGYISGSRNDSYKNDAALFIDGMKNIAITKNRLPFASGQVALFQVTNSANTGLQLESGGKQSPFGLDWDYNYTFVAVANVNGEYIYAFAGNDEQGNFFPLSTLEYMNKADSKITNMGSKALSELCIETIAAADSEFSTCTTTTGAANSINTTSTAGWANGFLKFKPTSADTVSMTGKIKINGILDSSNKKVELLVTRVFVDNRVDGGSDNGYGS